MVYEEIANRRPVIYCGSDPAGGHAFVCDGYSENEFFHFNWGWGGMADGYYMLSALNPAEQGIGGSSLGYGFNSGQDIVTGVQPPVEGSSYFYPLYASGNFTPFPYTDEESGESFYIFGFGNGRNYMIIYTAMELDIATGLRVENLDGEILTYIFSELEHIPGSSGYNILGLTGFGVDYTETGLPEGRYKIYPVVKGEDGDIQLIPTTPTANNFAFMDIDAEGNVSFKIPSFNNKPDISISDFELYTSGTALIPPSYYVTFRNNDPEVTFSGDIDISIYDPSQDVDNDTPLQTDSRKIRIPADSEICITWDFTPVIPVGDYVVVFRSPADEIIGKYPISIVDFPKPSLEAEDIEVPEKFEYNRHNPFAFWLLNNSDIMYSGNVRVEIIDEATMTSHNSTILDTTIKPWDSVELRFYWRINESRDPEGNYLLSFYDKWNRLIGGRSYVFNVTSGIDGITTDEAHKVTVYNMQGLKVAENISTSELPDLGKGVFVVVGPQGSYKISQ